MPNRIREILQSFEKCNILVVGDLILDHYAFGTVHRISPEAPIQVFDFDKEEFRLGGAANVAHNLVKLNAKSSLIGVVGKDSQGETLRSLAQEAGIQSFGILSELERPTTTKTRLICQGHHLLRTDREKRHFIKAESQEQFFKIIQDHFSEYNSIIISDYAKGLLTEEFCKKIISMANSHGIKIMIGPKGKDWNKYKGAYILSANRSEVEIVSGISLKTRQDIEKAGRKLLEELNLQAILITLGAEGMYLNTRNDGDFYLQAEAQEVFDVVGAGDTVLSVLSLVLTAGYSWKNALTMANTAAGIVVGKVGVAVVYPEELIAKFVPNARSYLDKIKPLEELLPIFSWQHSHGKVISFVYGNFFSLTSEVVQFMENCKNRCDLLVVGLFDNLPSCDIQNKNFLAIAERTKILAGLSSIDWILSIESNQLPDIIQKIQPDNTIQA